MCLFVGAQKLSELIELLRPDLSFLRLAPMLPAVRRETQQAKPARKACDNILDACCVA